MKKYKYIMLCLFLLMAKNMSSQDTQQSPVNLGTKSASFEYTDTKNTEDFNNDFEGQETNDVFYKFTLSTSMDLIISHCGSMLADTYLRLLDDTGYEIDSNDDNYDGGCTNGLQSYLQITLSPGTYYVVSEGYGSNGYITTTINGICPMPSSGIYGGNAASSDQNYILTITPTISTSNVSTLNTSQSLQAIQYFDGLGRPVETVQRGITPGGNDLVTYTEYDDVGREWKQWLPAPTVTGNNGAFVNIDNFKNNISTQYGATEKDYSFAETVYEQSPLNRIKEQFGAGNAWKTANKRAIIEYETNASEVKYFFADDNNQLIGLSTYLPNTLYKITSKDEDGKQAIEYKDKLGRVVMQRNGNTDFADTYYAYNDLGQLCYVIPPLAADILGSGTYSETTDAIKLYGYVYKYDDRGNCIYKKLPGCEPIYMVYDKAYRLILSQDGNQRSNNQWIATRYDVLGRVLYTYTTYPGSVVINDTQRNRLKNLVVTETYNGTGNTGYTYQSYSIGSLKDILTVNYYDNYSFISTLSANVQINLKYAVTTGYSKAYPETATDVSSLNAKGMLTGSKTFILDGSGRSVISAMYYDDKGQVVQTRSTNHLGGYDIVYNELDFTGKPNKTLKEHSIPNSPADVEYEEGQRWTASTVSELYTYEYDHAQRLLKTKYQINNKPEVILTNMTTDGYDELGRLKTKKRHNGSDTETFTYNIRNWTSKITSGSFEENLFYNTNPSNSYTTYNGNISYSTIKNGSTYSGYNYKYDELNRLTDALFKQGNSIYENDYYNENFGYNKMGNIEHCNRTISGCDIDALGFTYNGNQVTKITDDEGSRNEYNIKEYQDISGDTENEMSYDANGNLKKDLDRDIVTIKYNVLNLPDVVQFKNGNQIRNLYDAGGRKLHTEYLTLGTPVVIPIGSLGDGGDPWNCSDYVYGTEYMDNFEYTFDNDCGNYQMSLDKIYNSEGYSQGLTNPYYFYYRKDHLGNNREVWCGNTNYTVQRTQYYPSGLPREDFSQGQEVQNKKYNGKEFVEAHGYDMYDYGARGYYSATMRFTSVDPLAENYYDTSPYVYCANNPVNCIDPDGMKVINGAEKDKNEAQQKLDIKEKEFNEKYKNENLGKKDFKNKKEFKQYKKNRTELTQKRAAYNKANEKYTAVASAIEEFRKTDPERFEQIDNLENGITGKNIDVVVTYGHVNPNSGGAETYATYPTNWNHPDLGGDGNIHVTFDGTTDFLSPGAVLAHEFGHASYIASSPYYAGLAIRTWRLDGIIQHKNISCQNPKNWNEEVVKDAIEWQKRYLRLQNK